MSTPGAIGWRTLSRHPVAVVVAALLLLELGLRAGGFERPMQPYVPWQWSADADPILRGGDGLHVRDARQLWIPAPLAPIPGCDGERVNAAGYRGPQLAPRKRPGVLRIAALGGSETFGEGVCWRDTWPAQLAAQLEREGVACDVLDAGVLDFSIEQAQERLSELVTPFEPDVVVYACSGVAESHPSVGFGDRSKIEHLSRAGRGFAWLPRRGVVDVRVLQLVFSLLQPPPEQDLAAKLDERRQGWLARSLFAGEGSGQIDWPGKRRVTAAQFEQGLTRLATVARAGGMRSLWVALPVAPDREAREPVLSVYTACMRTYANQLDVPLIDMRDELTARENGDAHEPAASFFSGDSLSPRGHTCVAEALARELRREGLVR